MRFHKMKRFTAIAAALTLAFALCAGACAAEKPQKFVPTEPIMPLSQIKPGMTGYAKTVFSGTKITPFEISVIGVLPRKTFSMGDAREKRFYMEARRITG